MANLRQRQQDILEFIGQFLDGKGYPPSVRDIQEGCRLLRNGGYICGDDLEVQWDEAIQDHAEKYKNNEDYVKDTVGRHYHPGVTVAVYEELGKVTCYEGYWIMQKQGGKFTFYQNFTEKNIFSQKFGIIKDDAFGSFEPIIFN